MKSYNHIIFCSLLCTSLIDLNAQCAIQIDTTSFSFYNGITGRAQTMEIFKISNNSACDYFTWITLESALNKTDIELVHEYFREQKPDFDFLFMMYENLLEEHPVSLGYSFLKNIRAGETFSYFIIKEKTNSDFYRQRLVLIKREKVERYLRTEIDEKYCYKFPYIVLSE